MAKYLNLTANATLLGAIPGQAVGLAVPSGDSIASIDDVDIVVSDATLLGVTSIVLGAAPKEIVSRNYAAGQWVSFNLAALRVVSGGEVASVKIAYTTAAGLKRSDLLQVLVTESELVAEVDDLTGAAASFASALDLITVTAATNLDRIRVKDAAFVDAEVDLGLVPGSEAQAVANTAKLQSYFGNNATTRQAPLRLSHKDFWVDGPLHSGNDPGFRSFKIFGTAGSEYASQHHENPRTIQVRSRLIIKGLTGSTPWLRLLGNTTDALQPGMVRVENLTIAVPTGHTGSVFDLGDPSLENASDDALIRGAAFQGCYFTHWDLLSTSWLTDLRINPARNYAIRATRCYDLSIQNCGFRGFAEQILIRNCDRPLVQNTHHFHALRAIVCAPDTGFVNRRGVPGVFSNIYCETPLITGFVITAGQVTNVRCEVGYDDVIEPNQDVYLLPGGMAWAIAAGGSTINLTGIPAGRTAADYFMRHMVVKAIPSQTYNPARWYYITEVAETGAGTGTLTFANAATQSYTKYAISGNNTTLHRPSAIPLILAGDRTELNGFSLGFNHDRNVPMMVVCPITRTTTVYGGSSTGSGPNPGNVNQRPQIVGHCCGTQHNVHTGVAWYGYERGPINPLAEVFTPEFNSNHRTALKVPETSGKFDLLVKPGRGIQVAGETARDLQFHPLTEQDGSTVFAYKMNEAAGPWLPPGYHVGRQFNYTARIYADAAMVAAAGNNFTIWDGFTQHNHLITGLSVGWRTFTGTSGVVPTVFNISQNRNVYVAWVGLQYV